jgi:Ca2+-binding EF-hand superfamily protein
MTLGARPRVHKSRQTIPVKIVKVSQSKTKLAPTAAKLEILKERIKLSASDKAARKLRDEAYFRVKNTRSLFILADDDRDGLITEDDFADALKRTGFKITDAEARQLYGVIDSDKNGSLSYEEFCTVFNPEEAAYADHYDGDAVNAAAENAADEHNPSRFENNIIAKVGHKILAKGGSKAESSGQVTSYLMDAFKKMHSSNDGFITYDEFRTALGPGTP